ncbi:MAG: YIP1 family protein [Gemmatimonadota bacterium]
MTDAPAAPNASPTSEASVWEDVIDIFISPAKVFARRRDAGFGLALVILAVALTVMYFVSRGVLEPVFDAEFRRGMADALKQNPQLTEEQLNQMRTFSDTFGGVFIFGFGLVAPLLTAAAVWLVGKAVDSKLTYRGAAVVSTYAFYPRILESVVNAVQGFLLPEESLDGRYRLTLGVGRFLDPDTASKLLLAVVGRIDLFTLWVTFLIGLGLHVNGKVAKGPAFAAAAIVWLVGALPGLWQAMQ